MRPDMLEPPTALKLVGDTVEFWFAELINELEESPTPVTMDDITAELNTPKATLGESV
jgi:hypothetical protein